MRTLAAVVLLLLAVGPLEARERLRRQPKETGPAGFAQPAKPATVAQPTHPRGWKPKAPVETETEAPAVKKIP